MATNSSSDSYLDIALAPFKISDDFGTKETFNSDPDETADWSDFDPFDKNTGTTNSIMMPDQPDQKENNKPATEPVKDGEQKPQVPVENPADGAIPSKFLEVREVVAVSDQPVVLESLPKEKQEEIRGIMVLQGTLMNFAAEFCLSEDDRTTFMKQLREECCSWKLNEKGQMVLEKLPEIGQASKEGYERLVKFLTAPNGAIMRRLDQVDDLQLQQIPGMKFTLAGRDIGILKNRTQIKQEIAEGKATLGIDTKDFNAETLSRNLEKIIEVKQCLGEADIAIHNEIIERKEVILSRMLERQIAEGNFPESWRRPENMDKEQWCSAIEQTMNTYKRFSKIVDAIALVQKAEVGWKTEAFDNFPKPGNGKDGITLEAAGPDGRRNIKFGDFMMQDLSMLSATNGPKLAELNAWCDKYEEDGKKALAELFRAGEKRTDGLNPIPHKAIGYGVCEISNGFIDTELGAWTTEKKPATGENWKSFNLLTYDMKIQTELDVFGKPSKIIITPDCTFYNVPPVLGYCNFIKFPVHSAAGGEPLEYKPKDYVAVQTGPDRCEMMRADEVADWKALNQLKDFACTATIVVMDGAMIASGGMAMLGAKQIVKIGAEQAISQGAKYLSTKALTNIPAAMAKEMVTRQFLKGGFEFGLGVLGPVTHGAGSKEIPVLKTVGDLRTAYFFLQGVTSISSIVKAPQLAKAAFKALTPGLAARAEGVANFVRGSKEVTEAMRLAETGAFHSMGESWLGAEKAVQKAFSWSETAMVIETIVDFAHAYNESQKHPDAQAKLKALGMFTAADLLDASEVQKKMENPEVAQTLLQMRLQDYKKSLGTLSKEEAAAIDDIIKSVVEVTKPNVSDEKRQQFLNDSVKYFRYSGSQIKEIRRKSTETFIADSKPRNTLQADPLLVSDIKKHEPYSIDEYEVLGKIDDSRVDPKVRKMASVAALIVWQVSEAEKQKAAAAEKVLKKGDTPPELKSEEKPQSDVVAKRTIITGEFTVELPVPEGQSKDKKPTIIEKESKPVTQEVTLKELYDLVSMDLNRDSDLKSRIGKAAVLAESGLITREHQASLLLTQIDGTDPKASKQDKINAVVELGRAISKVSQQETARTKQLNEQNQYVAKGIASGLSSTELKAKLADLAKNEVDPDLKATMQFTLDFLNKKHIDEVDQKRYADAFLNSKTGISDAEYQKQLQSDFASQPKDAAGWERKLIASNQLLNQLGTEDKELALKIFKSFKDCGENCPFSNIKLRALETMLKPLTAGGAVGIDKLAEIIQGDKVFSADKPAQDVKKEFIVMSLMLFESAGIKDSAKVPMVDRKAAAEARAELINILTPYVKSASIPVSLKLGFEGQLCSMIKKGNVNLDWSAEARTAAVKSLGILQFGNRQYVSDIKYLFKPEDEPSAAVRLAAIETLEKMMLNTTEIKDFLGPLAATEPDFAVQERLRRYYTPGGSLADSTSQASKQETTDKAVDQNKTQVTSSEVGGYLRKEYPCLLKSNNLTDYMDPSKKFYVFAPGHSKHDLNIFKSYDGYLQLTYDDWWTFEKQTTNSDMMVRMEAVAAVEGVKRYGTKVDELAKKASENGAGTVVLGAGPTANTVSERQAAIYALGYLLQNGPQMGEEFYKHRTTWDNRVPLEGTGSAYVEFSPEQRILRQRVITGGMFDKELDVTDYKKNGITPPTSGKCWTDMELRIANHFKNLATESRDLPLLQKQIIDSLKSDKIQSDEAKAVLVEALDKMVSRPNVAPEAVAEAVNAVADVLGTAREGKVDGVDLTPESLNKMIEFLNKHAVKKSAADFGSAFEPFSKEANAVRTSVNSRMSSQNTSTPSVSKLRANDMFEQQWQSVLGMFDRRPQLSSVKTKDKFGLLPKDLTLLEKESLEKLRSAESTTSIDKIVDTHVQMIVDATNGDTIADNDPRIDVLTELTSEKYHNRVRLAAAIALLNGRPNSNAKGVLEKIATDCDVPAYRNDAMRALERTKESKTVSDSLAIYSNSRRNFIEEIEKALKNAKIEPKDGKLDKQSLDRKSDAELIQLANSFVTDTDSNATSERKAAAIELRIKLYEYGATLTNVGTMQMRGGKEFASRAEQNLKNALSAFGVDESKLLELRQSVPSYRFDDKYFEPTAAELAEKGNATRAYAQQLCDKLAEVEIFEDKNSKSGKLDIRSSHISSLVRALNSYSQLNATMMKDPENKEIKRIERTVTALSLSGVITDAAYLPGSGMKAESYQQIAKTFRTLAESNRVIKGSYASTSLSGQTKNNPLTVPLAPKSYEAMMKYLAKAEAEYKSMAECNPASPRALSGAVAVRNEMVNGRVQQIKSNTNREMAQPKPASWTLEDIEKMTQSVEQLIKTHPDQNQLQPRLDLVQLYISRSQRQTDPAKKLEAEEKALSASLEAIKLSLVKYKADSPEFESAYRSLLVLCLTANKPEWSENFFKKGFEVADSSNDVKLKKALLAQQYKFLVNFGRKDEAAKVQAQWQELTKPVKSTQPTTKSAK